MLGRVKSFLVNVVDYYRRVGYKNVHPTCHIGGNVRVFSKDNLIMAEHSNVNSGAVIMNTRAKFVMGKYSGAAMNLFVVTGNHMSVPGLSKRDVTDAVKDKLDVSHEYDQDVVVEEDVWIGANVMLLAGAHIGRGAIVGGGSVVRGKVPPYSVVSGNPAKVTSFRFRLDEIVFHESKLYEPSDRLSQEKIEKAYYDFYGKPVDVSSKCEFTEEEYKNVFKNAFNINANKAELLEAHISEEWDSLGHVKLMVEMEKAFGVSISTEKSRRFKSYASGLAILKELGVKFVTPKIAYVFPGQGSQFVGMGKKIYEENENARELFEKANDILGFRITDIMFEGTDDGLRKTEVTQPAVFLCSVIPALISNVKPYAVAGHSLGEFSALVVAGVLSFEDALKLVSVRARAMQRACDINPGTMAAVLQREIVVDNAEIERLCQSVDGIVVPANYNCPGQIIISGEKEAVNKVSKRLIDAGVKRVVPLNVGGAFHSPLMELAKKELEEVIGKTPFMDALCPIYQNVDAKVYTDKECIKSNLIKQLTSPVLWDKIVCSMSDNGVNSFVECGPGNVLSGLISKIKKNVYIDNIG